MSEVMVLPRTARYSFLFKDLPIRIDGYDFGSFSGIATVHGKSIRDLDVILTDPEHGAPATRVRDFREDQREGYVLMLLRESLRRHYGPQIAAAEQMVPKGET